MENNRKDPRRQLIGVVNKALGQQFERDINAAFDHPSFHEKGGNTETRRAERDQDRAADFFLNWRCYP